MAKSGLFGSLAGVALILAWTFLTDDENDNDTVEEVKKTASEAVDTIKEKAPEIADTVKKAITAAKKEIEEIKEEKDVMDEWMGKSKPTEKQGEEEKEESEITEEEEITEPKKKEPKYL